MIHKDTDFKYSYFHKNCMFCKKCLNISVHFKIFEKFKDT